MAELLFDWRRASAYHNELAGVWHSESSNVWRSTLGVVGLLLLAPRCFIHAVRNHRDTGLRDASNPSLVREDIRESRCRTSLSRVIYHKNRRVGEQENEPCLIDS